jgi:hypothetical protein
MWLGCCSVVFEVARALRMPNIAMNIANARSVALATHTIIFNLKDHI